MDKYYSKFMDKYYSKFMDKYYSNYVQMFGQLLPLSVLSYLFPFLSRVAVLR